MSQIARRARRVALTAGATLLFFMAPARSATASGFFLTDRGVRPLARGGAFVAGADDQGAVWYNPAGLVAAGRGFLADFSFIGFDNSYRRVVQPTAMTPPMQLPAVSGSAAPFPIPTLVFSHNFGVRNAMFAAGLYAPNAVITSFPSPDATPAGSSVQQFAPQRYSLVSLDGSLLAIGGVWFAYQPIPQFAFGVGVQALFGSFASQLTLSACPATVTCQPEDPAWDALTQLRVGPIFAPTGNVGVRVTPSSWLAIGASFQLPIWISAPARLQVRLPSDSFFDGSRVEGDRAGVDFTLAPILRLGVEVRPTTNNRIEIAFAVEFWGMHDAISLAPARDGGQPNGIRLVDARAINVYEIGPQSIVRNFNHAVSIRVGAERSQPLGNNWFLWPRLGFAFESSATSPAYTSVMTPDSDKFIASLGLGVSRGAVQVDAVFAHAFAMTTNVGPRDGGLQQIRPFRVSGASGHPVNGGVYDFAVNVFGVGTRIRF